MEWPRVFRIWKPERCLHDFSLSRRSLFRVALLRGLFSPVHRYRECLQISRTGDGVARGWFRRRRLEEGSSDNGWFRTGGFVQCLGVAGWRVSRGGRGEKVGAFEDGGGGLGGSSQVRAKGCGLICFRRDQGCTLDSREFLFSGVQSTASRHQREGYTGVFTLTAAAFFAISGREPPAGSGFDG